MSQMNERRFKNARDARMSKIAKMKNAKMGGTKEYRRVGGKLKLTSVSAATRRSRRHAGKRLRRISRTAGAKRAGKMTKRLNKRFGEASTVTHSPAFLSAIQKYVAISGRADIGAALAETIDPRLTNTPVGLYAMDVADGLDENSPLGNSFVDCIVLDENTVIFTFEDAEGVTEQSINAALKAHGGVELLARPGDAISESETTDMYLAAVTIPAERLEGVMEAEDGDDAVDESEDINEQEMGALCSHTCFESAVAVA